MGILIMTLNIISNNIDSNAIDIEIWPTCGFVVYIFLLISCYSLYSNVLPLYSMYNYSLYVLIFYFNLYFSLVMYFTQMFIKAYPHDTIVVHNSSLWLMRFCHKNTIPACYSLANVAIGPKDSYN